MIISYDFFTLNIKICNLYFDFYTFIKLNNV